jgi:hypothetical protein
MWIPDSVSNFCVQMCSCNFFCLIFLLNCKCSVLLVIRSCDEGKMKGYSENTICLSVTLPAIHTLVSNYCAVTEAHCSAMPIFHKICALRKIKLLLSHFLSHLSLPSPSQSTEISVALMRIQVCTVSAIYCMMF